MQRRLGSVIDTPGFGNLSYVEALKERIHVLRARAHEENGANGSPASRQGVTPASQADTRRYSEPSSGTAVIENPHSDLHDTMQEASYLSLAAMAERTDRQPFPTEGLSFLTLLYAAIGVSGENPAHSLEQNAALSGSLADFRMNTVYGNHMRLANATLFSQYVEFIQRSYPFVTSVELNDMFELVMRAHESNNMERLIAESPETVVIVNTGLATAVLLSPGYAYKEVLATDFVAHAVELLSRVFDHANDISIVRCLTALTIYSMYTTFGGSTWHLLGLTMTRCVASGMHTSRISDPNSDEEEKQKNCRTFWTLYVLDTYISSTLDRPFCLSDNDVMVSPPLTTVSDGCENLHSVVEHAQLLRSIRQQSDTDAWIHYINLGHWQEALESTVPSRITIPTLYQSRLYVRGLIELIKQPSLRSSPQRSMILNGSEHDFAIFLSLSEDSLLSQTGASSPFDAFHVFTAGIIIMQLPMRAEPNTIVDKDDASRLVARQRSISQAINILTILSVRYPPIRGLREVLVEYQAIATHDQRLASLEHLRELIGRSDIMISSQLKSLILGEQT
jgi:hypothetical protein